MGLEMASLVPPQATFLLSAHSAVLQEFGRIAVSNIVRGEATGKGYASAAKKLEVDVDAIEHGVLLITNIFIKAARYHLASPQFIQFLRDTGFHEAQSAALAQYFAQVAQELSSLPAISILSLPCYRKLEWRLDIQLASRSLRNCAFPSFLLKLSTCPDLNMIHIEDKSISSNIFMQIDYIALKTICKQLEKALAESRRFYNRHSLQQLRV